MRGFISDYGFKPELFSCFLIVNGEIVPTGFDLHVRLCVSKKVIVVDSLEIAPCTWSASHPILHVTPVDCKIVSGKEKLVIIH